MSEHFVKNIKIQGYKCFKDFSAEGFGRVNLISGKNNVGKTALMEALFLNVNTDSAQTMIMSLNFINFFRSQTDREHRVESTIEKMNTASGEVRFITNINSVVFESDDSEILKEYEISINGKVKTIPESSIKQVIQNTGGTEKAAYISSVRDSQASIIRSFKAIQQKDRESDVYDIIQKFDNSIENVKVIGGDSIECKVIKADGSFVYRNISEFGDGLRHYISIISDMFAAEGKYLFIDELDNGIHYSSLDQLWQLILTLSKELNVQVFATTHSRECIESYCRVAEKLKEKDISFITLVRNKEKAVKAIVRDYEVFTDSIHDNREVRGW